MSTETGTGGEPTETTETSLGEMSWRYLMGAGAVLAVLGVLAIIFPFVTGVALSVLLGALLVVGALVHFAQAFSGRGWTGFVVQVLLGLLYAFAGISLMANPVVGLASLTILLVVYLGLAGVLEVVQGFRLRAERNWVWPVASGVISIALAALLWVGFPSTAAWAVGLLFGVSLLTSGLSMVMVAMGGRAAAETATAAAGTGGA